MLNHTVYAEQLTWLTDYDEAVEVSKKTSKPMLLFFTGSDWCTWCMKLDSEVLSTPDFVNATAGKFVFVKLDFPMNRTVSQQNSAQKNQLQKKFGIRGFPTIVLLDSAHQRQIGTSGYRPGGGKQYADFLFKLIDDHNAYQQKMQEIDKKQSSAAELKQLYEKAKDCASKEDAEKLLQLGMESDQKIFFQIESYRALALQGKINTPEAVGLKRQLLASDPENRNHIHYEVAIMDFEDNCTDICKMNMQAEQAVAPLVEYIDKFGKNDLDNVWRLEMIISQVFFEKNKLSEALKYAQSSYNAAPASVQPEIANAMKNIQSQLLNNTASK